MKIILHDNNWGEVSVSVNDDNAEWFEITMNEYNDFFEDRTGERPITLIAKERIFQKSEVYKDAF